MQQHFYINVPIKMAVESTIKEINYNSGKHSKQTQEQVDHNMQEWIATFIGFEKVKLGRVSARHWILHVYIIALKNKNIFSLYILLLGLLIYLNIINKKLEKKIPCFNCDSLKKRVARLTIFFFFEIPLFSERETCLSE